MNRGAWQATAHGVVESYTTEQLMMHTKLPRGAILITINTKNKAS